MKLQQVILSQSALKNLLEAKLPVKTAYWISKMVNSLQPELKAYETARLKLIKELGEPVKDTPIVNGEPQDWQVKQENLPKFIEEITKLGDEEIPDQKTYILEDLVDITLTPQDLIQLEWLIK